MKDVGAQISIAVAVVGVIGAMLAWLQTSLRAEMRELHGKLSGRIDAQGKHLEGRIDAQGNHLEGRIDGLDNKLSGRIDTLGAKIDGLAQRVGTLEEDFRRAFKLVPASDE